MASILNDRELDSESTVKKFLTVQIEGSRKVNRNIDHYNLDMIIIRLLLIRWELKMPPVEGREANLNVFTTE